MRKVRSTIALYRLLDLLEIIIGAVSLVCALFGLWRHWNRGPSPEAFFFIVICLVSAVLLIKMLKHRKMSQDRLLLLSEGFLGLAEAVRNDYYYIRQLHAQGTLDRDRLLLNARATGQHAVDLLASILSVSTEQKVSVCIKYFPDIYRDTGSPERVEDYYVGTLCRSSNSSPMRDLESLSRIGENTDFLLIMKEHRPYFRVRDLHRLEQYLEESGTGTYRNSNPEWSAYYRSTIVVPIRMERRLLVPDVGSEGFDLLGFLCADSLSTSAFRSEHLDAYTTLMKAFASVLHPYLDRVYSYLHELNQDRACGSEAL
jgi:hypothetical protein